MKPKSRIRSQFYFEEGVCVFRGWGGVGGGGVTGPQQQQKPLLKCLRVFSIAAKIKIKIA